jgi:hypothetical protein
MKISVQGLIGRDDLKNMLQKIIKNIRAKPESVRKGITLSLSLGVTAVASFFWFISFLNYSNQVLSAEPSVESPTNFLGRMSSLIGESYANVRTKIDPTKGVFVGTTTESQAAASTSVSSSSNSSGAANGSKSLNDILNTKSSDKQGAKATTSSEVLVQ